MDADDWFLILTMILIFPGLPLPMERIWAGLGFTAGWHHNDRNHHHKENYKIFRPTFSRQCSAPPPSAAQLTSRSSSTGFERDTLSTQTLRTSDSPIRSILPTWNEILDNYSECPWNDPEIAWALISSSIAALNFRSMIIHPSSHQLLVFVLILCAIFYQYFNHQ